MAPDQKKSYKIFDFVTRKISDFSTVLKNSTNFWHPEKFLNFSTASPKSYKSFKIVINWWNRQHPKSKILFIIIPCLVLIAAAGLPGFLGPDKNTQISQMSTAVSSAQPMVNDFYTSLKAYDTGTTDSNTVLVKLEADKKIVDSSITIIQSVTPPNELKHPHSLVLSALQDLSTALGLGIDGVKTNNFPEIYQAMGYKNDLTKKFNEAAAEVSKLGYPSS